MDSLQRNDTFKSISAPAEGIYKEKGSKFLAFAYPVVSEEEVKAILESVRKEYYDARHHCYAWRLGLNGNQWRYNDDGEPSSTAGRPIYGQILSRELSDVLIVVVRYFGGTKLGVPGLIRAYRTAAADDKIFNARCFLAEHRLLQKITADAGLSPENPALTGKHEHKAALFRPYRRNDII